MFSHVTLGTNDWQRARPFWIAVMEVLGHPVMFEHAGGIAFGSPTGPKTFVGPPFDRREDAAPSLPESAETQAGICQKQRVGARKGQRGRARAAGL